MQPLALPIPTSWARLPARTSLPRPRLPRTSSTRCFGNLSREWSHDTAQLPVHPDNLRFEHLPLQPAVIAALRTAFPSIEHPTYIQYQFIDAVLKGKDVLLKDKTGSGKSFALVLALLSQKRFRDHGGKDARAEDRSISSLLLVPHKDLVFQIFHWIERIHHHMTGQIPLPTLAQVLVRDSSATLEEHIAPLRQTPPQILIGTPQAVLDAVQADPKALPLARLSTVVVDEVDYLVPTVPELPDRFLVMKLQRQLKRHPGPTRLLLNHIYSISRTTYEHIPEAARNRDYKRDPLSGSSPQLVVMSATLRNHLRRFLLADSGWFSKESGKVMRITGSGSEHHPKGLTHRLEDKASLSVGGTGIQHHALIVSERGGILNIRGAAKPREVTAEQSKLQIPPSEDPEERILPSELPEIPTVDDTDNPSPFNPSAMEAIGTAFALDVPSIALLVLPSDSPVQRAVYDLRQLGVNAHALDVVKDENGRTHLMRRNFDSTSENPTLLVSTLASTRGLDLPELSHVFIFGVLDGGAVDSYLHVAGRVGRFGRGGKVISVLAEKYEVLADRKKGKMREVNEPQMMGNLLKKMGITPVRLEHFD